MKLLVFIGFIFISIPFISSFSSITIDEKQVATSRWIISLPVADLVVGEVKALPWAGGLVWVYARTEKDLRLLNQANSLLLDAHSDKSDQPERMKNNFRSASEKFFVFIPLENKRGCQVSMNRDVESALFTEPCFSARYDSAGRIFKSSGHDSQDTRDPHRQQNLAVPEHVIEEGVLKIGIWMRKTL
jgi:Rieske Fe-S protein